MKRTLCLLLVVHALQSTAQSKYPAAVEGDYKVKNFEFESKETLPEMNLHYYTMGTPQKDKNGKTTNAVIVMHGTTGTGCHEVFYHLPRCDWSRQIQQAQRRYAHEVS
jgi:homoserine O-acetyltransferase/O-succinyltransferase